MHVNSNIPSINFDPFLHGSADDRKHVASAVDAALSSAGFMYLENHGIERHKVDKCFELVS